MNDELEGGFWLGTQLKRPSGTTHFITSQANCYTSRISNRLSRPAAGENRRDKHSRCMSRWKMDKGRNATLSMWRSNIYCPGGRESAQVANIIISGCFTARPASLISRKRGSGFESITFLSLMEEIYPPPPCILNLLKQIMHFWCREHTKMFWRRFPSSDCEQPHSIGAQDHLKWGKNDSARSYHHPNVSQVLTDWISEIGFGDLEVCSSIRFYSAHSRYLDPWRLLAAFWLELNGL